MGFLKMPMFWITLVIVFLVHFISLLMVAFSGQGPAAILGFPFLQIQIFLSNQFHVNSEFLDVVVWIGTPVLWAIVGGIVAVRLQQATRT